MGGRLLQSISSHIGGVLGGMLGRRCWNWVWHVFTEDKEQSMVDNRLNMRQLKSLPSILIHPLFLFFRKKKKGMWSQKTCFLPGEYKRAVRDGKEIPTTLGKKEKVLSMCAIQ